MCHDSFSEQLRRVIDESGLSHYAVCKRIAIDQATMSRFMHGRGGMSIAALDRLGELLGLRIVAERKDG
jgi:transcriptional regulator with XRE-family HTH domain